jgi:hypothetical protein
VQVTVDAFSWDVNTGEQTYGYGDRAELVDVTGYQTFRQVVWAGSRSATTMGMMWWPGAGAGTRPPRPEEVVFLVGLAFP